MGSHPFFGVPLIQVRAAIVELPETESLRRVYVDGETPAEVQPSGLHTGAYHVQVFHTVSS